MKNNIKNFWKRLRGEREQERKFLEFENRLLVMRVQDMFSHNETLKKQVEEIRIDKESYRSLLFFKELFK